MDLIGMVPQRVPGMGSDQSGTPSEGAAPTNRPESSPLSFFGYLSDFQIGAVAVFASVHEGCGDDLDITPTWGLPDLVHISEVAISCPSCGISRTYGIEGR